MAVIAMVVPNHTGVKKNPPMRGMKYANSIWLLALMRDASKSLKMKWKAMANKP